LAGSTERELRHAHIVIPSFADLVASRRQRGRPRQACRPNAGEPALAAVVRSSPGCGRKGSPEAAGLLRRAVVDSLDHPRRA
jgi:hypothetical protein